MRFRSAARRGKLLIQNEGCASLTSLRLDCAQDPTNYGSCPMKKVAFSERFANKLVYNESFVVVWHLEGYPALLMKANVGLGTKCKVLRSKVAKSG